MYMRPVLRAPGVESLLLQALPGEVARDADQKDFRPYRATVSEVDASTFLSGIGDLAVADKQVFRA